MNCYRFVVLPRPVCLERGVSYKLRVEFIRYAARNSIITSTNAFVLVDSVSIDLWFYSYEVFMFCIILTCSFISSRPQIALLPRYSSLEMFTAGDPDSVARKQSYERYRCHETAKSVSRPQMSEVCAKLITSMSALINDGALRECQQRMLGLWREYWGLFSLVHVIQSRTLIPQLVSAILRVRSSLSVMSVGDSAAASPTYQAGAVINVHQELTALALPAANVRQIFSLL